MPKLFLMHRSRLAAGFLSVLLIACGGGNGDPSPPSALPVIVQEPISQTTDIGQPVTFSVVVRDETGMKYQWLRDGAPVAGATKASYTLVSPRASDTDSVWAVEVGGDAAAKVTTPGAKLYVRPAGKGLVKFSAPFPDTTRVLAVDSAGNLFVRSSGKSYESGGKTLVEVTIRKFSPQGQAMAYGPAGIAGIRVFEDITAAAMDPADNLYLAFTRFEPAATSATRDGSVKPGTMTPGRATGMRIQKVDSAGRSTVLHESARGDADFTAATSLASNATGTLYIGDAVTGRVIRRSPDGTLATVASAPFDPAYLGAPAPSQLAVTRDGRIYLASRTQRLVMRLNADGTSTVLAGNADSQRAAIDGTGAEAGFLDPAALVADAAGNLYVADISSIRKITPAGVVTTVGLPPQIQSFQALPPLDSLGLGADGVYYTGWGIHVLQGRLPQ